MYQIELYANRMQQGKFGGGEKIAARAKPCGGLPWGDHETKKALIRLRLD